MPQRKRTMPGERHTLYEDPALIWEVWCMTWRQPSGGQTQVCVPVKFHGSRQKRGKPKISLELRSFSVVQSSYCCFRGRRLRIENKKLATQPHDRRRFSLGSGYKQPWLYAEATAGRLAPVVEASLTDGQERRKTDGHEILEMLRRDSAADTENTQGRTSFAGSLSLFTEEATLSIKVEPALIPRLTVAKESITRQGLFPPMLIPGPGDLPPFEDVEVSQSMENIRMTGAPMRMSPAQALAGILKIVKTKAVKQGILAGRYVGVPGEASHYPMNVCTLFPWYGAAEATSMYSMRPARSHSSRCMIPSPVSCAASSLYLFFVVRKRARKLYLSLIHI